MVAPLRIRACNDAPSRPEGEFVLYWMIANRRRGWSFPLQRAVALAQEHRKPLVILEPLRCGYRWASDRFHAFVLQGMADNRAAFADAPVLYHAYVEPSPGAGQGLLEALAARAVAVVTDDWPGFFLPRMVAAAAERLEVRLEAVDSCGLLPLRATTRVFTTAHSFRAWLQKNLLPHLEQLPAADPLRGAELPRLEALPADITRRWPAASEALLEAKPAALAALPIDHSVGVVSWRGGARAGQRLVQRFLDERLERYLDRNQPDAEAASGLSAHLHFGHVSPHQVFDGVAGREGWEPGCVEGPRGGKREGWWRMSAPAEAFLDELITWREIGLNMAAHHPDHERYSSLPEWARTTLEEHLEDTRPQLYDLETLAASATHDPIWNAAQTQLRETGRLHNYLRMLWGKKILEWTASPREALDVLLELNNRYALDGRDPNSISGIFWVLGRYDRAWGPERPVFGKVRFMSSDSTRRKLKLSGYLERYGAH